MRVDALVVLLLKVLGAWHHTYGGVGTRARAQFALFVRFSHEVGRLALSRLCLTLRLVCRVLACLLGGHVPHHLGLRCLVLDSLLLLDGLILLCLWCSNLLLLLDWRLILDLNRLLRWLLRLTKLLLRVHLLGLALISGSRVLGPQLCFDGGVVRPGITHVVSRVVVHHVSVRVRLLTAWVVQWAGRLVHELLGAHLLQLKEAPV